MTPDEIRDDLRKTSPEQWPVMLECAESCLKDYGFKTLAEFVTAPANRGGLQIPLAKAKDLLFFNPAYKGKAQKLCAKLGIAELAKSVEPVIDRGKSSHSTIVDDSESVNYKGTREDSGGNSSTYRIAKLKRDHPEIAARLEDGEFATVAEAERAAGVKPPKRNLKRIHIDMDDSVNSAVAELTKALKPDDLLSIADALNGL